MSGHSKWSTIKRQKGANDAKRGALFTKLAREIITAARQGGGDAETNYRLRMAIEKAKSNSMPADNIKRAVERATGAGADAEQYEEITYEGIGPGERGRDRRGDDRQPEPHRLGDPKRVQQGRRNPVDGRVAVRAEGRHQHPARRAAIRTS